MIGEKALSVPEVQELIRLINSRISFLNAVARDILVLCQRNIVFFCFKAPKETMLFPFRCMGMALDFLTGILPQNGRRECNTLNVAEMLTGNSNPNYDDVCNASRQLCAAGINAIINQSSVDEKIEHYKDELKKWSSENEKKIEEMFSINDDLTSLSKTEKHLKLLNVNTNQLVSVRNNLNSTNISMTKQNACLSVKDFDEIENIFKNYALHSEEFMENKIEFESVLSKIYKENEIESPVSTDEKLTVILYKTEDIQNELAEIRDRVIEMPKLTEEVAMLRGELEREHKILKAVEKERDDMKIKLTILEVLFQDQENYLNNIKKKREDESNNTENSLENQKNTEDKTIISKSNGFLPNESMTQSTKDILLSRERCPMQ